MIAQTVPFRELAFMVSYLFFFFSFFFVFLFFISDVAFHTPLPDLNGSLFIGAEPGHCALSFRF